MDIFIVDMTIPYLVCSSDEIKLTCWFTLMIIGSNMGMINLFKRIFNLHFKIKNLRELHYFPGLEVA